MGLESLEEARGIIESVFWVGGTIGVDYGGVWEDVLNWKGGLRKGSGAR